MSGLEEVLREALRRVTPSPEEGERVARAVEAVRGALRSALEELSVEAAVEVEGSFAKGTWLPGDVDVDVFLLFDPSVSLEDVRAWALAAAEAAARRLGVGWVKRYASHPYLTLKLDACDVDVVPAYRVPDPSQIKSPVDRTPFHTRYVVKRLGERPGLAGEARLLKRFMKGVGVYGAEIRVEGFSGYLIELLAIHYGSFLDTIRAAARWRPYRVAIDIEGHYASAREALQRFREPLVVVDPVDPRRNVASPVSLESLSRFIAASREFLRRPSLAFFFPPEPEPSGLEELLEGRGVVAVKMGVPELPEDILWGQAKRALRALASGLERFGFRVFSTSAWSDGSELVLLFELEQLTLPPLEKHEGPPVHSDHDERFLSKYAGGACVAGPYVEGDRWVVIRPRTIRSAPEALEKLLRTYNVGGHIAEGVKRGFAVLVGREVARASGSGDFRLHLYEWLVRRPRWLQREQAPGGGSEHAAVAAV